MPRKARSFFNTGYYHVMVQGINKSYIFANDEDAKKYINLLNKINKDYKINLVTYCVMKNHCHILINADENEEMSSFMKRVNLNYAIYYNKKYERVGYVFRDRFKSQAILSEKQLYTCIHYIYNNPVKANICKTPQEYPYLKYKENMYDVNLMDESYEFLEILEEKTGNEKQIIEDYIKNNNLNIKDNKEDLRNLVFYLKNEENISFRKIENLIGINRKISSFLLSEDK